MYSSGSNDSIVKLEATSNCLISHMRKQRSKAGHVTSVQLVSSSAGITQDLVL